MKTFDFDISFKKKVHPEFLRRRYRSFWIDYFENLKKTHFENKTIENAHNPSLAETPKVSAKSSLAQVCCQKSEISTEDTEAQMEFKLKEFVRKEQRNGKGSHFLNLKGFFIDNLALEGSFLSSIQIINISFNCFEVIVY